MGSCVLVPRGVNWGHPITLPQAEGCSMAWRTLMGGNLWAGLTEPWWDVHKA